MTRNASVPSDEPVASVLRTVDLLAELGAIDWLFADLYHERARSVLSAVCDRDRFLGLVAERAQLARIASQLERGIDRGDWRGVQALAREAGALRERVQRSAHLLETAAAVYQLRPVVARPKLLALAGIGSWPVAALRSEAASLAVTCRSLAERDPVLADLYRERADHYASLGVVQGADSPLRITPEDLLSTAREAAARQDFTRIEALAHAAAEQHRDPRGRVHAARPDEGVVRRLGAPLPAPSVGAARELGLEPRELRAIPELEAYLGCTCSEQAELLDASVDPECRPVRRCTCGHPCPPGVRPSLEDTLDLLMGHVFVSSAGVRYLPWFGAEHLLVESFPEESGDPSAPILDRLGLPGRGGLSRAVLEQALCEHGPGICREIGLDPLEFRLVCIPFDAYLRLAPELGWGQGPKWTHFDGYQVTRDLKVLGLVGGDARYGGPDDLCSVGGDYGSERLLVRLAIVRRERLAARARAPHARGRAGGAQERTASAAFTMSR